MPEEEVWKEAEDCLLRPLEARLFFSVPGLSSSSLEMSSGGAPCNCKTLDCYYQF